MLTQWLIDLSSWWAALSPAGLFLFLLPFLVVAAAALAQRVNPS